MANVVYGGAYATEVIAAQRVFYNQKPTIPYQLLLGMLVYPFLVQVRYELTGRTISAVYSIIWVLLWWPPETLSRLALLHDMAGDPRQLRHVQYSPLLLLHVPRPNIITGAIFLLLFSRVVFLVLGTWLPIHCTQRLQFCLLDRPG